MSRELSRELLTFLHKSPSSFHAVYNLGQMLKEDGYVELFEKDVWDIRPEGKYFVKRNDTSIIAFHIGKDLSEYSFNIAASHSDFPTFKIKEKAGPVSYTHLDVYKRQVHTFLIRPSGSVG